MMRNSVTNSNIWSFAMLIWLLLAMVYAGAVIFQGTAVFAQSTDGDDGNIEVEDFEDSNEGADVPITGTDLQQASAAALAYMGEGRVSGSEVGDEEGYYEIEITLENGRQVDVHLDAAFNVLGYETD